MSKVAKATIGLFIVTMISKVFGFARETILVSVHGAGMVTDAFITSMNIPTVIFSTIGSALATTFIPMYYTVEKDLGKEGTDKFVNNIFNIIVIISLLLSIIGYIFSDELVKIFAMSYTGEKLKLASEFTRIMIWGMVFIGLSNIMTCLMNINSKFIVPSLTGIPFNIIIILGIYLSAKYDVRLMPIFTLVGMASQFLFQVPVSYKDGYRYKFYINIKDKYIKKMLILVIPVFIGVGVNQLNTVVDKTLASTLGNGIITILNSASILNTFVIGVFISSIQSVVYPLLSKLSSEGNGKAATSIIRKSVNVVIILMVPITIGIIVLSVPIVQLAFERGKFDHNATLLTASALSYYAIGLTASGLRNILGNVFYSFGDTKTPMRNGMIAMFMNICMNLIFIKFMGHCGLAFATSISATICILLLFISLKKKIKYFGQDKILITTIKSIIASLIMGIVVYMVYKILSIGGIYGTKKLMKVLFVTVVSGIGVYAILIHLMKIDEVEMLLDSLKNKFKRIALKK
ncbi:murein biosynthesis integral membrane protein MurJ [Peptacetobacter sp.]|uniref:murein biosynthesis integral membrane protein MurJ n=1 Tax=Peptacetobacter sp. TaxID=2991975 RepID=UPI002610A71D|nr:murein biosynthesis integral membrane protein MurJ [Peptacetobacter sp.]